jgi:hypothetical protein
VAFSLDGALSLEDRWKSMTFLYLSDDHHAGHNDTRFLMRRGIIDRLSPLVRAEVTPTFSLRQAAIIWCSSRHSTRYPRISPNPPQPVHLAYIQHLGSSHSPLSPLYHCSAVAPSHRSRPSHSSTHLTWLQSLRHRHPSLTSGLHPFRLHRQDRKYPSTWQNTMREFRVR